MTPDKVALGQMLFFDPRLSGSGAISCASCHNPALGWGDAMYPRAWVRMGGRLRRHTPAILNVAYGERTSGTAGQRPSRTRQRDR